MMNGLRGGGIGGTEIKLVFLVDEEDKPPRLDTWIYNISAISIHAQLINTTHQPLDMRRHPILRWHTHKTAPEITHSHHMVLVHSVYTLEVSSHGRLGLAQAKNFGGLSILRPCYAVTNIVV